MAHLLFEKKNLRLWVILPKVFFFFVVAGAQNNTEERIYTQVDHMPQVMSCSSSNGNMYKMDRCTNTAIKAWMLANMQYPEQAVKEKRQEKFSFKAIIDTSGILSDIEPLQTMTSDCAIEAQRLIQLLLESNERWLSGRQGNKKVKVQIELMVDFNLADWNAELARRTRLQEAAKQDSILKSGSKVDSFPKRKS